MRRVYALRGVARSRSTPLQGLRDAAVGFVVAAHADPFVLGAVHPGQQAHRSVQRSPCPLGRWPRLSTLTQLLPCPGYSCGSTMAFTAVSSRAETVSARSTSSRPKRWVTRRSRSTVPEAARSMAVGQVLA
ncbi:hypothetical protein DFQ14_10966 [Halopolyspora algeriensis]|uniref:Uncharacterized protein n=1 Tax=Halopolyspora algeriensis TaxID=1500506 RepID=A0A368VKB2_9ACTN|nr:hypothetical protein DFQ14_10966 [Halopolyspora algeriensis]TQM53927.1 hypothetical protein FHU43_2102 [Halopolyspora algeriensis]